MKQIGQMVSIAVLACGLFACGSTIEGNGDDDGGGTTECTDEGVKRCTGSALEVCTGGDWAASETCTDACHPQLGCVSCVPGTGTCDGDTASTCRADGTGFDEILCDPEQGVSCSGHLGE